MHSRLFIADLTRNTRNHPNHYPHYLEPLLRPLAAPTICQVPMCHDIPSRDLFPACSTNIAKLSCCHAPVASCKRQWHIVMVNQQKENRTMTTKYSTITMEKRFSGYLRCFEWHLVGRTSDKELWTKIRNGAVVTSEDAAATALKSFADKNGFEVSYKIGWRRT